MSANWITNDPQVAKHLKAADKVYTAAVTKAAGLKLADKVAAIRAAKLARQAAYDALMAPAPSC